MPKQNLTDITVVLDRSGSMSPIAGPTISGMNEFIDGQKKIPGEATLTLIQFDHEYTPVYKDIPIQDVPALTRATFVPRGNTALLDAIGRAIVEAGSRLSAMAEADRPETVIFAVMTDGLENASCEYEKAKIDEMISHQRDVYSWQFLFLGANQDAIARGASMGFLRSQSMSYAANSAGTKDAFESTSDVVASMRMGNRSACYTDRDRQKQREHGAV